MDVGQAVNFLRAGFRVTRAAWHDTDIWLWIQRPATVSEMTEPYICRQQPDGSSEPWTAEHADLLADDWQTVHGS